jgi:hypothetical protein
MQLTRIKWYLFKQFHVMTSKKPARSKTRPIPSTERVSMRDYYHSTLALDRRRYRGREYLALAGKLRHRKMSFESI